jgi:hypothetical protein
MTIHKQANNGGRPRNQTTFSDSLTIHQEKRKHRKIERLNPDICDSRMAFFVTQRDCGCGKKCLDRVDVDITYVLATIIDLRRQIFGQSMENIYTMIRIKLEGVVFEPLFWHVSNVSFLFSAAATISDKQSRRTLNFSIGLAGKRHFKNCRCDEISPTPTHSLFSPHFP